MTRPAPTYAEIRSLARLLRQKMPLDVALRQAPKSGRVYDFAQWTESLNGAAKADPALAWIAVAVGVA